MVHGDESECFFTSNIMSAYCAKFHGFTHWCTIVSPIIVLRGWYRGSYRKKQTSWGNRCAFDKIKELKLEKMIQREALEDVQNLLNVENGVTTAAQITAEFK